MKLKRILLKGPKSSNINIKKINLDINNNKNCISTPCLNRIFTVFNNEDGNKLLDNNISNNKLISNFIKKDKAFNNYGKDKSNNKLVIYKDTKQKGNKVNDKKDKMTKRRSDYLNYDKNYNVNYIKQINAEMNDNKNNIGNSIIEDNDNKSIKNEDTDNIDEQSEVVLDYSKTFGNDNEANEDNESNEEQNKKNNLSGINKINEDEKNMRKSEKTNEINKKQLHEITYKFILSEKEYFILIREKAKNVNSLFF